jgi:hypothetical protein
MEIIIPVCNVFHDVSVAPEVMGVEAVSPVEPSPEKEEPDQT